MSPLVAMWVASILGAILFFIAGYLAASRAAATAHTEVTADETDDKRADDDRASPDEPAPSEDERAMARLRGERDELEAKVERLESELATRADAQQALETRVGELQTELAERPAEVVEEEPASPPVAGPPRLLDELLVEAVESGDPDVLNSLARVLERRVESHDNWRAITLADDLCMPVVGAGEKKEALAAFSGLVDLMEMRTRALLPIKELRRVTVEDVDGVIITTCTMPKRNLSLVALTENETPETSTLTELLEHTARRI